jgi:hypothetical protein
VATTKKKLPAPTVPSVPTHSAEARRRPKGGEPRENPKRPAAQEVDNRDVIVRKDGRRLRKKQVYFDADTALRLAVHCARKNVDISDYLNAVVEKALDEAGE